MLTFFRASFKTWSSGSLCCVCVTIRAASGALRIFEVLYLKFASSTISGIPSPPKRVGKLNIDLSSSEMSYPKIVGSNLLVIRSSMGCNNFAIPGIVRMKYVNLCLYPFTYAL